MNNTNKDWKIFKGNNTQPHDGVKKLPPPPSWRPFGKDSKTGEDRRKKRGETFQVREDEIEMINAALYLRRPLLVTGKPGMGKSSIVYAVAKELKLGEVLYWTINTRTTLKDGLYNYDAISRLQEAQQKTQNNSGIKLGIKPNIDIGKYITLGPLGTAFLPSDRPRVLLVDEIDKGDIDLPNDLLTILEEGRFEIPELDRIKEQIPEVNVRSAYNDETEGITKKDKIFKITNGSVNCDHFPFVVLTSNGERDFPPAFLRRCLCLNMKPHNKNDLDRIIAAHLVDEYKSQKEDINILINNFVKESENKVLSTDQLLNAIFMLCKGRISTEEISENKLIKNLLQNLEE